MDIRQKESYGIAEVVALLVLAVSSIFLVPVADDTVSANLWRWTSWSIVGGLSVALVILLFHKWQKPGGRAKTTDARSTRLSRRAQNDDRLHPATVSRLTTAAAPKLEAWSKDFIASLDRRRFERLCRALWQKKGYLVQDDGPDMNQGVDFYLCAGASEMRIGAVRFEGGNTKQISDKALRKLQKVVAAEWIPYGLLMHNGSLSVAALEFIEAADVTIRLNGTVEILDQIRALPETEQIDLMQAVTSAKIGRRSHKREFTVAHSAS